MNSAHIFTGLSIWEIVSHLPFDWGTITGKRTRRWSFYVYICCRYSPLLSSIFFLLAIDSTPPEHCQAYVSTAIVCGMIAFTSAAFIMLLRLLVVWSNRYVRAVAALIWFVSVPIAIYDIVSVRGGVDSTDEHCSISNTYSLSHTFAWSLLSEIFFLISTLAGLLRTSRLSSGRGRLWTLLYRQGLIWLVLDVATKTPLVVLSYLNLNDYLSLILAMPALMAMTFCSARVYRSILVICDESQVVQSDPYYYNPRSFIPRSQVETRAERVNTIPLLNPDCQSPRTVNIQIQTIIEHHEDMSVMLSPVMWSSE